MKIKLILLGIIFLAFLCVIGMALIQRSIDGLPPITLF